MAKRKSAYTRVRNQINQYLYRQRKKGIEVDIEQILPSGRIATETELRRAGLTGSELTHQVNELKKLRNDIKNMPAYMVEEPSHRATLGTLQEEYHNNLMAQKRQARDIETPVASEGYEAYARIMEAINQPIPTHLANGNYRSPTAIAATNDLYGDLIQLINDKVMQYGGGREGQEAVGILIQQEGLGTAIKYIDQFMGDNYEDAVQIAYKNFVDLLFGSLNVEMPQRMEEQLTSMQDNYDNWTEPEDLEEDQQEEPEAQTEEEKEEENNFVDISEFIISQDLGEFEEDSDEFEKIIELEEEEI